MAAKDTKRKNKQERFRQAKLVGKAFTHRTRLEILEQFTNKDTLRSPNELAEALGERLGNTSYHVRQLFDLGAVELRDTAARRGAVEHFYALTPLGQAMRSLLRRL